MDIGQLSVGGEEPCTKDWLGEDVEDSISNDFLVNGGNAGAISNTPDAVIMSVELTCKGGIGKTYIG